MKTLLSILALVAASFVPATAYSQAKLRFAHGYEVSEPFHTSAIWAASEIARRTGNRYQIDVFPASQLGKEADVNQGLTLGTVDMILTGSAFIGRTFPPASIGGAPFIFRDFDHYRKYTSSPLFAELAAGYQKASGGNTIVATTYFGTRHVTSNKPIRKPEDMRGLKIRVPDAPLYLLFPKAMGANPTPIAFSEVYMALQTKTVDAQENPLPTIDAKKFYEVQSHISMTGHIIEALFTVVSGSRWNSMTEADRTVFSAVLREAAERATAEIIESERKLGAEFAAKGKTLVPVDTAAFIDVLQKVYRDGRHPDGSSLPWSQDIFTRLQAIK